MVAVAVLSSLLVARLATSLLAAYWLQPTATQTSATTSSSKLKKAYLTLLAKALHFRKTTLLLGGVFLVVSAMIFLQLLIGFVRKATRE